MASIERTAYPRSGGSLRALGLPWLHPLTGLFVPLLHLPRISAAGRPSAKVCARTGGPWTPSRRLGGHHAGNAVAGVADPGQTSTSAAGGEDK